jgi:hypothetical protein
MRTREESLISFTKLVDELINSRYLFANSKIFEIITAINSSKLLSDVFNYFTDKYDFETALVNAFVIENDNKTFILPDMNTDVLAFVYSLLREINYKNLQLTDLLDYFDASKNYELAYQKFAKIVLLPFKSYVYQIGMQMINSTQTKEEANLNKNCVSEEPINVDVQKVNVEDDSDTLNIENSLKRLVRLLDLDRLAVRDSRLSSADVQELMYLINIFEEKVKEGDSEKISLIYLAYVYAVRPFKKLKTNIKAITEILMEQKII